MLHNKMAVNFSPGYQTTLSEGLKSAQLLKLYNVLNMNIKEQKRLQVSLGDMPIYFAVQRAAPLRK